jgi:hypothetical protein
MARQFEAITTCSVDGWNAYGARMTRAFRHYWPAEVPLTLYTEGDFTPVLASIDAPCRLPQWLFDFKERHRKNGKAHGKMANTAYNFRFDAVRFAHKTAAVIDAAERSERDLLIWIDADTVTHSQVTIEFLRELAPGAAHVISWLDRQFKYPECGFYILNLRNPETMALIREWKALYTSDLLFHLPEWHDSYVLETLIKKMHLGRKSISGPVGYLTSHPFINSPLGAVMDHMKGDRKTKGISRASDLKAPRSEDYWKGVKR